MPSSSPEKRSKHNRTYYLNGGSKKIRAANKRYQERNLEYIRGIKAASPCADCGVSYPPCVMDFDHLRDKTANMAVLVYRPVGLARLMEEVAKCEIVCANCHRMRTAQRAGRL